MVRRLTVVYDDDCELCCRCRNWLSVQPTHVPLEFLAADDPAARERYGDLPSYRTELMVVADDGTAWVGPAAFVVCMWATVAWRETSQRLASPAGAPAVESFFRGVSSNNGLLSGMLRDHRCDARRCGAPR